MLASIEDELQNALAQTLDEGAPRFVSRVEVVIETNLGESRRFSFQSLAEAAAFLDGFEAETVLNDQSGPTLWDIEAPIAEEE